MELEPKDVLKMLVLSERGIKSLRRLDKKSLYISSYMDPKAITDAMAATLKSHGFASSKTVKGNPPARVLTITAKGRKFIQTVDFLEKADKVVVLFKPCVACSRTDGYHTMMCPVKLGIMEGK